MGSNTPRFVQRWRGYAAVDGSSTIRRSKLPVSSRSSSGGYKLTAMQERSYSTIMYLMALSEMARVPFSLVDEINQVSRHFLRFT